MQQILTKANFPCYLKVAGLVWAVLFVTFSTATAQIREDNQANNEKLDEIRRQIEQSSENAQKLEQQARDVQQQVADIQQQLIKSAAEIQSIEDKITQKEQSLRELRLTELEIEANLKVKNFEMASTLGAMQRSSRVSSRMTIRSSMS